MTKQRNYRIGGINMKKIKFFPILLISLSVFALAQSNNILIDEDFSDWNSVSSMYEDTHGDQNSGSVDFYNLWVSDDTKYVYLSFSLSNEIQLQLNNNITLYIDSDDNSSTGNSVAGIGAELKYTFSSLSGILYTPSGQTSVNAYDLGLIASPTVSSDRFELAFNKSAGAGGFQLFPFNANKIKVVLRDSDNDQLPDEAGGFEYTFENNIYETPEYSISKLAAGHLRFMTYNVEHDGLTNTDRKEYFERIIKAVNPDIIGFEEVVNGNAEETKTFIEQLFPGTWYAAKPDYDRVLVSRYPIEDSDIITTNGYYPNDYFLLNTESTIGKKTLVILAHPKCCSGSDNDVKRQTQVDAIMSFIRNVKNGAGPVSIAENTPIVIMGDMNFVGESRQRTTLLTGDIQDNTTYGNDFTPDWDMTNLEDAKPFTTGTNDVFTNYNDEGDYIPGRLDYIIYTGSVLSVKNSYALFTPGLTQDELTTFELQKDDSKNASDHIPVVVDFTSVPSTGTEKGVGSIPKDFRLENNYPNPFNPSTKICYSLASTADVEITIYDSLGRDVWSYENKSETVGLHSVVFDSNDDRTLSSGTYFVKLVAFTNSDTFMDSGKIMLVK